MSKPIEQVYDGIRLFNTNIKAARSKEEKDCLVWVKDEYIEAGEGRAITGTERG